MKTIGLLTTGTSLKTSLANTDRSNLTSYILQSNKSIFGVNADSWKSKSIHPISLSFAKKQPYNDKCTISMIVTDSTKLFKSKVLFGRSRLKTHVDLHGKKKEVNLKKRNQWINEKVIQLKSIAKESDFELLSMQELIQDDFFQMSVRLIESGKVIFQDGSYLYFVSTSAHSMKDIGDVTIALKEDGDVYINHGHICGGIIHFKTHKKSYSQSSGAFLTCFKSDTDDQPWLPFKEACKE